MFFDINFGNRAGSVMMENVELKLAFTRKLATCKKFFFFELRIYFNKNLLMKQEVG